MAGYPAPHNLGPVTQLHPWMSLTLAGGVVVVPLLVAPFHAE